MTTSAPHVDTCRGAHCSGSLHSLSYRVLATLRSYQWHGPEAFQETAAILKSEYGFESGFLHLASVGTAQPLADPYADVPIIQKAIEAEVDKGRDVILVVHSYGGIPGCNALKSKLKKDAQGGNGVIGIAFQCVSVRAWARIQKHRRLTRRS